MWKTILIILALLYALSPYDLLPDFMIGWGWLDDLVVLGLLARYLYRQKKKREAFQNYYQHQQNTHDNDRNKSNNAKGPYGHKDSGEFSHIGDPYKILGIDRSASQEDIKRAYRALAGKYHPDKVEHLGEEFKELAENRFKDIQRAYQELKRWRTGGLRDLGIEGLWDLGIGELRDCELQKIWRAPMLEKSKGIVPGGIWAY